MQKHPIIGDERTTATSQEMGAFIMIKSKKALALLHDMSGYLRSDEAISDGRSKPSAFVRTRKLPFTVISGMILNSPNKITANRVGGLL